MDPQQHHATQDIKSDSPAAPDIMTSDDPEVQKMRGQDTLASAVQQVSVPCRSRALQLQHVHYSAMTGTLHEILSQLVGQVP